MNKSFLVARIHARRYSDIYSTSWYVRYMGKGMFEAYAHSSDDNRTVAEFYCGKAV